MNLDSVPFQIIIPVVLVALLVLLVLKNSFHAIDPSQVGLVTKRFGKKSNSLIALNGEAGYQADLLMPGMRIKVWPFYSVKRYPWVQVPPDHIGLVISQVGVPLPTGAKSATYKAEFGNFEDVRHFLYNGGMRGVQRPVLPPGTTAPIHPIGFVVITPTETFGEIISHGTETAMQQVDPMELKVMHITPQGNQDIVGGLGAMLMKSLGNGSMNGHGSNGQATAVIDDGETSD